MGRNKVVFVMSAGHSGSTLLDLILGSHSAIFGLGELNRLCRLVELPPPGNSKFCWMCDGECEFWNSQHIPPRGPQPLYTEGIGRFSFSSQRGLMR